MLTVKIATNDDEAVFEARQVRTVSGSIIIETPDGDTITYAPGDGQSAIYVMNGSGSTVSVLNF